MQRQSLRNINNITSYGILFIGAIIFCLMCYSNPWLWNTSWIAVPALVGLAYISAPKPDPQIEYPLPTAEGIQIPTGIVLTDNNLAPAVLHVFPEWIQVITNDEFVRVEMHEMTLIEMRDLSNSDGELSGFSLVYQKNKKENNLLFAARVGPWVTKGVVKLLLETYDEYYKGTTVPPLPYVEVANTNTVGMVRSMQARSNEPIGGVN